MPSAAFRDNGAIDASADNFRAGSGHTVGKALDGAFFDVRIASGTVWGPEVYSDMWKPPTRWDLYYELGRRTYFFVSAVAADPSADTVLFMPGQHQPIIEPDEMVVY